MPDADDVVLVNESREDLKGRLESCKGALDL